MLQIPQPFGNDIQGRDTSLVPIVIIGIEHFLSIKPFFFHGQNYSPLLDPIPSLKESIDIETRKYKISNVTINIINSEYEGKRFSDHIISPNTDIIIRWVSPSATLFLDSMLIYVGKVRDYKFDDSRVTITAEDKSQSIVHVNMPINKLGVGDDVPDNYKGKPYPIVYGDVDKSPCVLKSSLEEDEFGKISGHLDIYPWFVDGNNGNIGITENLQTYHADSYMPIPSNLSSLYTEVGTDSGTGQVFSTFKGANSSIVMDETVTGYFKLLSTGNNPISNNLVPIRDYRELNELKLIGLRQEADLLNSLIDSNAGTGIDALEKNNNFTTLISGRADLSGITYEKILGSFVRDSVATVTEWDGSSLLTPIEGVDNDINPELQVAEYIDRAMPAVEVESGFVHGDFFGEILIIDYDLPVFYGNVEERYGSGTISLGIVNNLELLVSPHSENFANDTDTDVWHSTNLDSSKIFVFTDSPNSSKFTILLYLQGSGIGIKCATKIDLNKLNVIRYGLIKSPIKLDYYARAVSESSSIISILKNIFETQLSQSVSVSEDQDIYSWNHDFTISKVINSKKLIEELASSSPYIPRFNYLGNFTFNTIGKDYFSLSYNDDDIRVIKDNEVIDFSYSQTRMEDVYTKVVFHYKYDYALDKLNSIVETSINAHFPENTYKHSYYGFEDTADSELVEGEISNTTLVVDDHRGKYIRDDDTAGEFANWLLLWHCNQHLKITLQLPLKYMPLEIGDIIKFEEIISDITPYGIDYSRLSTINGQGRFNAFMITSTNKQLDKVVIEATQMHILHSPNLVGCTDETACNYDETVVFGDPNSCEYADPGCDCNAPLDACGICGGDSSSCADCAGVPNGGAIEDDCEVCDGGNADKDCNGDCFGTAELDNNGICCDGNNIDYCGVCNGSGQCSISECYNYYSEEFCDEVLEEHDYFLLHCDYCQYAVDPCPEGYDCSGECGGSAVIDECGVCNGSGIADGACDCNGNIEDCAGVCGGFSWIDSCGVCVPSGSLYDGHEDCTGVCFGDSAWDECQVCNGPGAIYECGCYDIPEGACSCGGGEYQNDCGECEDFPCTCLPCTDPYSPMYIPDPLIPGDQQQVCGELGEPDICPNQLFTTEYICDIAPWRCVDGEFVSGQNGVWDVTDLDLDEYPWDEIHSYCNTLETCQHCHPIYSGFYAQGSWINFDNDDELVSPLEGLLSSALSGAEFAGDINKYPIIVKDNHPACSAELTPEISEYEISRVDVTLQLSDAFENDSLSSATNQVIFNNGISEYQGASMDTNSSNYELINEGRLLFRWDMIDASPELVEFGDYDVFANIKIKTIPNPDDLSNFETIYETDGFELCPRIEGHLKNLRYLNIGGDIVSAIQSQEINTFENYYFEVHIQVSLPNSNELISIFNKGSNYRLFVHDGSEEHSVGDNNLDGGFNVLDILVLVDCILNDSCFYVTTYFDGVPVPPYVLDTNGDGVHNVMDIVSLVICILAQNCGG